MDKRGKLIVIDGSDGVGKATQTKLLIERLRREKVPVETLDFPQYGRNFFGTLIRECLDGKHGDFIAVDPHIASALYAADRFESKTKLEEWLKKGKTVVLDRYVSANQLHQGGKIRNPRKRRIFLQWLDKMEHEVFKIPRPDLVLYLHLPTELSLKLIDGRGKKDQAESNVRYLSNAKESALKIIKGNNAWAKIECSRRGQVLPREIIHKQIFARVRKVLRAR
ncbi:MAG TPA: deoxynucleoside kinase [Candidatus Paceibacterota bacterium]|nr:deoxynucleoside kinase [Candidatus Paceibacterota bacterium]